MNTQLICFKHCKSRIFCSNVPEHCPECKKALADSTLSEAPFRLPFPFVKADQHPCAVVIKPTEGTFLDFYQNDDYLHIGLTDSEGSVCEYDSNGLHSERSEEWKQSILIYKISESWINHWDSILQSIQKEPQFTKEKYNEDYHNCYTFILEFLKRLRCEELDEYIENKQKFCEKFVVPRTKAAAKYISLYRKVKNYGYISEEI